MNPQPIAQVSAPTADAVASQKRQALSVLGLLVVLVVGFLPRWHRLSEPLDLDEADYLYAASFGFVANALDQDIMTPDGPSDVNRERHRHPPGLQYIMMAWRSIAGDDERTLRLVSLMAGLATITLLWFAGRIASGWTLAGPFAAALLAAMPFHIEACKIFNMHPVSVLLLVAIVLFTTRALQTGRARHLYLVAVLVALQGLMMEYGVISGLTVVLCLLIARSPWFRIVRRDAGFRIAGYGLQIQPTFWKAVALLLAVYFVLWPGGLLRANAVLNFGYYAIEYARAGHPSVLDGETVFHLPIWTWLGWFRDDAPVFGLGLLVAAGTLLLLARRGWVSRPLLPAAIFGAVYLVVLFRQHTFLVRYSAHAVALMSLVIGWWLAEIYRRRPASGGILAGVLLLAAAVTGLPYGIQSGAGLLGYHAARDQVAEHFSPEERGLVQYASVLRHYLPDYRIEEAPIGYLSDEQMADLEAGAFDYFVIHRFILKRFGDDPAIRLVRRSPLYERLPVIRDGNGEPTVWIYRRRRGESVVRDQ